MTNYLKNKYPYLSHLKLGSLFYFVEIDMTHLVSATTIKKFENSLAERAKIRALVMQEEDHYHSYCERRKIRDENKLNEMRKLQIHKASCDTGNNEDLGENDTSNRKESNLSSEKEENSKIGESNSNKKSNLLSKYLEKENSQLEKNCSPVKEEEKKVPTFDYNKEEFPDLDDTANNMKDNKVSKPNSKQMFKSKKKRKFVELNIDPNLNI